MKIKEMGEDQFVRRIIAPQLSAKEVLSLKNVL